MNPKLSINGWEHQRFSSIYKHFEGAEAIYAERPLISHLRVTQISFDDWGIKAKITDLLSPGMRCLPQNPFQISSAWEIFAFNKSDWDTPNIPQCRYRLFFHPTVLCAAIELAAKAVPYGKRVGWDEFLKITRDYYVLRDKELSNGSDLK